MHSRKLSAYAYIIAFILLALTFLEAFLLMRAKWPFSTDDAYITLRYARHWVEGHGIVWNPGENPPVEGYSNFTYLLLGAAALKLGLSPILVLKVVGAISLLATVILLYVLARRWLGPIGSTIPGICFVSYIGTVYWSVSGLETGFFIFLTVAATTFLILGLGYRATPVNDSQQQIPTPVPLPISLPLLAASGFLAFLIGMTRPEGPVVFLVLAATAGLFLARRYARGEGGAANVKAFVVLTAAFALPYSLYFGWRLLYFGRLMPNPVTCKTAYAGDPLELTGTFIAETWPYLLLAMAHRRWDVRHLALLGLSVIYALALIGTDPIIGHHNRHFLAAYGLLLVLAASGLVNLLSLLPMLRRRHAELLGAVLVGAVAVSQFGQLHKFYYDYSRFYERRMEGRQNLGETLNKLLSANESYVLGDAGITPFVSHSRVIDAYCLNNREYTEPPILFSLEHFVDDVLENKKPEAIVLVSSDPDRFIPWEEHSAMMIADERFRRDYRGVLKFGHKGEFINPFLYLREDIADERIARLIDEAQETEEVEAGVPLRD